MPDAAWTRSIQCSSVLDRDPDFEAAIAGQRVEVFVVALEARRIGRLQAGGRQPTIPDRVDGAPDGRDMVAMRKHRVFLFRNTHATEFARQVREIRYFDAGNIVVVAGVIAIAADAVRDLADPARKILDGLVEALPLPGNG